MKIAYLISRVSGGGLYSIYSIIVMHKVCFSIRCILYINKIIGVCGKGEREERE